MLLRRACREIFTVVISVPFFTQDKQIKNTKHQAISRHHKNETTSDSTNVLLSSIVRRSKYIFRVKPIVAS